MPVEEREGGLVERAQVRVGLWLAAGRRTGLGLGEVHRPVGHLDQRVLVAAVVGEAGDPDADRRRAARPVRPTARRPPRRIRIRDLMGDDPVGAGQDRHELVAAVAIEPVAVARRGAIASRDADEEARRRPGGRRRR